MKAIFLACMMMISAGAGICYFAYLHQWIIIQLPGQVTATETTLAANVIKKNVSIYYWHQGHTKSETTQLILSDDKSSTLRPIITSWLKVLDEAGCCAKKIAIETVMISPSGNEAYISFNRGLAEKNDSTYNSWMRIESLLKTIKSSDLNIQRVHFLVHHKPMSDAHLNFSQPWPIHGFLRNSR